MGFQRWVLKAALVVGLGALPFSAMGGTIGEGQVRTVEGRITAVDVTHRAVVLDVATPKGDLTVGVTLQEGVAPKVGATAVGMGDITVGHRARLKYTRQGDRLVGLGLDVRK